MKRYAVITQVEVYSGEDLIGIVIMDEGIGYKGKLTDSFMSKEDMYFVGKVQEYLDADGELLIEEEI